MKSVILMVTVFGSLGGGLLLALLPADAPADVVPPADGVVAPAPAVPPDAVAVPPEAPEAVAVDPLPGAAVFPAPPLSAPFGELLPTSPPGAGAPGV